MLVDRGEEGAARHSSGIANTTVAYFLAAILYLAIASSAYAATFVSVPFDNGGIGRKGSSNNSILSAKNFSSLGISEVYFRQASSTGAFTQQGNDIPGSLRIVLNDGTYFDVQGAINWRGPSGSIQYFGFIPYATVPAVTLSYNGQPYVLDSGSNYALIKNDSSFTFTNNTDLGGNAATTGLLTSLNSYLSTSQANAPLGPVTVNSQTTLNTTPTVTGTVTLQSGDTLSVFINGVEYNSSNGLIVSGNTWSITIPPSNALSPAVYSVDAVITNTQGYTLTDSSQSELVILSNTPAMTVTKTASTTSITSPVAGTTQVTYTIAATNTGAVSLTSVSAADTLTGGTSHNLTPTRTGANASDTSFDPGDTFTWSVSYTIDQSDINAGTIENVASVTGTPSGGGSALTIYSGADGTASTSTTPPAQGSGVVTTIKRDAQDAFEQKKDEARKVIQQRARDQLIVSMRNNERMIAGARDRMISRFSICARTSDPISLVIPEVSGLESGPAYYAVGDRLRVSLIVENAGTIDLKQIEVMSDHLTITGGPLPVLAPGASDSTTFVGFYAVKQSDLDRGYASVSATVSARFDGPASTVSDVSGTTRHNDDPSVISLGRAYPPGNMLSGRVDLGCHENVGNVTGADGNNDRVPFDVNGTIDAGYDQSGVDAAAKGDFGGQTGFSDGANYGISGSFNVFIDDGDSEMVTFDARLFREQFVHQNALVGGFVGADFSNGSISASHSFEGDHQGVSIYGGGYFVGRLSQNLYADGFASLGYGWNNLEMNTNLRSGSKLYLDGDYGAVLWQLGGALTGVFQADAFEFRPSLAAIYGNAILGNVGLTAKAYDDVEAVSLDAGTVGVGTLRLTPELRMAVDGASSDPSLSALSLRPSLICEYAMTVGSDANCGFGIGIGYAAPVLDGAGVIEIDADFESIGGQQLIGGRGEFRVQF